MAETLGPAARCRRCGEDVVWVKTEADKNMPLDPEPHLYIAKGFVVRDGRASFRTRAEAIAEEQPLYRSHFNHCR